MRWDTDGLEQGLENFGAKAEAAFAMYAKTSALKLQNYARKNRPWTDRTGTARQRLTGSSSKTAHWYVLSLAHGVNYGVFLELAHEKNFAIIMPTIEQVGANEIMPGFKGLLDRLGG